MENWNDERLDELSRRMDAGFEKAATKEEMNLRFDAVEKEMSRRFDDMGREMTLRFEEMGQRFEEMGQRFDQSAARFEGFESKVGTEFHRFTDRLDKLFYIQLFFLVSLAAALITDQA